MPSFKSAVLALAATFPMLSLAESTIEYNYVQASFAKSQMDSPYSEDTESTTGTAFTLKKDLGYKVVAGVTGRFLELKERFEEEDTRYGADLDQRTLTVSLDRYFEVSPTFHIVPGLSYSEIKTDLVTKFQRTDVEFFYDVSSVTYTNSSAFNLMTRYRLSEGSPFELSGTVSYATGEEEDSVILDLSAEVNISDIVSGRFSVRQDFESDYPEYLYSVRVYF
tara:strand:+ start:439 stop:1104 length:666 start_codon:yes stop_codon:yes gene_type:complete